MKQNINEISKLKRLAGIITENEYQEAVGNDISQSTNSKDDSMLYKTITNMVEGLRKNGFEDTEIETFLLDTVKQIISEV
jgi:DNA-binding transcriptional regulator YhcF (GntR family)